MPVQAGYPGIYIVEVPSGVRSIAAASTSTLALIGSFARGPANDEARRLTSLGDFERIYGGLDSRSPASYGLQQFFLQGGRTAYVVRVAFQNARATLRRVARALEIEAATPGAAGNGLRVAVTHNGNVRFDLRVAQSDGTPIHTFTNVSQDPASDRSVETVVNTTPDSPIVIRAARARPEENVASTPLDALLPSQLTPLNDGADATPSTLTLVDDADSDAITFEARTAGEGGREIRVTIAPAAEAGNFNLTVRGPTGDPEEFPDLTPDDAGRNAVNDGTPGRPRSAWIRVTALSARPDDIANVPLEGGSDATPARVNLQPDIDVPALVLRSRQSGVAGNDLTVAVAAATSGNPDEFDLTIADGTGPIESLTDLSVVNAFAEIAENSSRVRLVEITGRPDNTGVPVAFSGGGDPVPAASATLRSGTDDALTVSAANPGEWGNNLRVGVAPDDDGVHFDLVVVEYAGSEERSREAYRRLTALDDNRNAVTVVNAASELVTLSALAAVPDATRLEDGNPVEIDDLGRDDLTLIGGGEDGLMPDTPDWGPNAGLAITGSAGDRTGLYALDGIAPDIFNIMAIPEAPLLSDQGRAAYTESARYCADKRAFLLVDHPASSDSPRTILDFVGALAFGEANGRSAMICYPRLVVSDPLNGNRDRPIPASGSIAGVMARTDAQRGVWKAPAGIEAGIGGARPTQVLTDLQQGRLNKQGVSVIRSFPNIGTVSWGARTLAGADRLSSEWKYVPVRRMALFIEQSLFDSMRWVVFEPNDEPLWSQIRLAIGGFMQNLFLRGAFQGQSARQAYLVKCDAETTTQTDINNGIVNILVGFAPLRPAEFVVIRLQQLAGQSAA